MPTVGTSNGQVGSGNNPNDLGGKTGGHPTGGGSAGIKHHFSNANGSKPFDKKLIFLPICGAAVGFLIGKFIDESKKWTWGLTTAGAVLGFLYAYLGDEEKSNATGNNLNWFQRAMVNSVNDTDEQKAYIEDAITAIWNNQSDAAAQSQMMSAINQMSPDEINNLYNYYQTYYNPDGSYNGVQVPDSLYSVIQGIYGRYGINHDDRVYWNIQPNAIAAQQYPPVFPVQQYQNQQYQATPYQQYIPIFPSGRGYNYAPIPYQELARKQAQFNATQNMLSNIQQTAF